MLDFFRELLSMNCQQHLKIFGKLNRWALGVLIYFMLLGDMPFGSWRESELDTFAKIAKGQITLPQTLSPHAADLITKVLLISI